jgi:hypothetical protein
MERDVGISVEALAIFARFWLTTTPALPMVAVQRLKFAPLAALIGRAGRQTVVR